MVAGHRQGSDCHFLDVNTQNPESGHAMKVRIAINLIILCLSTARSASLPAVLFQTVVPQRLLPKAKVELQSTVRCLQSSPRNPAISLQSFIHRVGVGGITASFARCSSPVIQRKRGIFSVASMRGGSSDEAPTHDQINHKERIKVVVITGPTAVGKSALAEKLALVRSQDPFL